MYRTVVTCISIIAIFQLVLSCSDSKINEYLYLAESMTETRPDSALKIINSIDRTSLKSIKQRARFSLLHTQLMDKNYHTLYSDTVLKDAIDYYTEPTLDYVKTNFYQAVIYYNQKDFRLSIINAQKAYETAKELGNNYWIAKTSELIGDIFSNSHNPSESIKYTNEAINYYNKAGKIRSQRFALCDLALGYNALGKPKKGIAILDSIIGIAKIQPTDSTLLAYGYEGVIQMYINIGDYKHAKKLFIDYSKLNNYYAPSIKNIANLAEIELNIGHTCETLNILENIKKRKLTQTDKVALYYNFAKYYTHIGEINKAKEYTDSLFLCQNTEVKNILRESALSSQRDYYNQKALEKENSAKNLKIVFSISLIIVVIIVLFVVVIYRMRIKIKNLEIENKVSEIQSLVCRIDEKHEENASLRRDNLVKSNAEESYIKKIKTQEEKLKELQYELLQQKNTNEMLNFEIEEIFKSKWKTLNMLCNEFFEKCESDKTKIATYNNIQIEIKKFRDCTNMRNIEDSINKYMNGILIRIREQCTFLNTNDITFITLIYAGLSSKAISLLMDIKIKYFYNKKDRLISRVNRSTAKDKNEFILRLSSR